MAKQKTEAPKVNISQSLIKNIWDYAYGDGCGMALREIDILKKYTREPSAAMKLGQYFEYLCTGQVLRDGSIPSMPQTTKGAPTADAKRAVIQSNNFKKMLKAKGIEVHDVGVVEEWEGHKVVLDALISTPDYDQAILDIKFSGLLGDRWHDMGWTPETYDYRHGLKIQPIFYKYVYWKAHEVYDMPFYYAIHSSKNETDYDMWEVNIVNFERVMEELENELVKVKALIAEADKFTPRPEMKRCLKCPMFSDCLFREEVPATKSVSVFNFRDENRPDTKAS